MLKALLRLFRSSGDDDAEPARETIESETAEEAAVEHLGGSTRARSSTIPTRAAERRAAESPRRPVPVRSLSKAPSRFELL